MTLRTLIATVVLLLSVAACGGTEPATSTEPAASPQPASSTASASAPAGDRPASPPPTEAEDGAFPVTIPHRFGEATVEAAPERVVSVGYNDHDTLLALGTVPVGVREWYGDFPGATWPWAQDALGDAVPEVLPAAELDVEQVAALDPDLIVGIFSGMTEEEYALLSAIAPTIANPEEHPDYGTPWRDVTRIYGDALGVPDRAAQIVADVDARFEQVRADHPELDGAEGVVGFYAGGEIGAYVSADLRSRLLADLGIAIPQAIDDAGGEGAFYAPVSLEQVDLLDRDLVVWVTATEDEIAEVQQLEVLSTLGIGQEGRQVFTDFLTNGAFSFSSPLSIPFLLDRLVPQLAAAVDGDPSTEVPAAA